MLAFYSTDSSDSLAVEGPGRTNMISETRQNKHVEAERNRTTNTLPACPECGQCAPGETFVRSHWTKQHHTLGAFPGAELVTVELEDPRDE